jgi:hypothetical protein
MDQSQNSISTLLPQLLRLYNNSIESYQLITDAVTSTEQTVTVDYTDENNNVQKLSVPTIGFLKNEIARLDTSINTLTNFNAGTSSSILLSDGTFRKLVLAKISTEASDISSVNSITTFNVKDNYFFDEFITPLLYVTINLSGQVPNDIEEAVVKRFYLTLDTTDKINYFNSNYAGNANVNYSTLITDLNTRGISYFTDEEVIQVPPRDNRYYGSFNVIDVVTTTVQELVNGAQTTVTKKVYRLDKVVYSDSLSNFKDTVSLKIGDNLVINSNPVDTRYVVKTVDSSTNSITVELVEGSTSIRIGADVLKIYKANEALVELEIPIGYNENIVAFVKAVDPSSRIPAINWSPGTGFNSNSLNITLTDGTVQPLSTYYSNFVIDFGRYIKSLAIDKIPTSSQGLIPNSPVLTSTDFNVVQVNQQITNQKSLTEISDLSIQKNNLSAEIKQLDSAISAKRTAIANKNYKNDIERDADKNELAGLISQRSRQSDLYSSIVKQIDSISQDSGLSGVSPKYRVRGFFPLPAARVSPDTGTQQIVQFSIEYRYLNNEGAANPSESFTFDDNGTSNNGSFSNWVEYKSLVRGRTFNGTTGKFEWDAVITNDANAININQVDVPIQNGEQVEIRIKSISEAGWPSNPAYSDYSNSVIISFPENSAAGNPVADVVRQNQEDLSAVRLQEAINARGIDQHLSSSFTANERYFAHDTSVIASGFVASNQTPIDLFTKLNDMINQIAALQDLVNGIGGELSVSILDDQGVETPLVKDQLNKVFAGYYFDQVQNLTVKKGAIVTKTFFLNLKNVNQNPLELLSRVYGSLDRQVRESEDYSATGSSSTILPAIYKYLDNYETFQSSDTTYNTLRKYDLVPMILTSPDVTSNNKYGQINSLAPYQSSQVKSQFLYSRYYDVAGETRFYSDVVPGSTTRIQKLDQAEHTYGRTTYETAIGSGFIFGGSFIYDSGSGRFLPSTDTEFYNSDDNTIEMHISHPYLTRLDIFKASYESLTGDIGSGAGMLTTIPSEATLTANGITAFTVSAAENTATALGRKVIYPMIRQSKFANLENTNDVSRQQSIYLYENVAQMGTANTYTITGSPTLIDNTLHTTSYTAGSVNIGDGLGAIGFKRGAKMSFESTDQFLLGKKSCGAYLFLASDIHDTICVDGKSSTSTKVITYGNNNSIKVPVIFQYRMTDYYGAGSTGLGNIGGDFTGRTTNIVYAKRIGIDLLDVAGDTFSYDIEVFAKYKSDNLNLDAVPSIQVSTSISDLSNVISALTPNVPRNTLTAQ